jgi:HAMP domain-containing protein/signal transduction histidine kinase
MTPNRSPVRETAATKAKAKAAAAAAQVAGDGVSADALPPAGVPIDLQDLLEALTSLRDGDFSVRLPEFTDGTLAAIAERFNEVVQINADRAAELQRAARVIGREGRMTERVSLPHRGGEWAETATAINALIDDLVRPTTEVARVIAAVAEGDLSENMALEIEGQPVKGEFLRIGTTVNSMVDQLRSFADEVTRVAREVGTEGKLGGQAEVAGVSGTWKDLTDSVNFMAGNLTGQVRNIAQVTTAVANGDLTQKITVDVRGEMLELKDTINTMVDQLSSFADEVTRVAREVGTEGKLGGQAEVAGVSGTWKDLTDSVNFMAGNLTGQVRNIAQVTTAVANGDLSQKITVDVKGEMLELKDTINTMVDQLSSFADEVTRVAREVGTEGKLGGQAKVEGVSGTWKDLTENVNQLAGNLTNQVRNIAQVTTAVANGDLSQKITVDARGEILELKDTINTMVDQLSSFADEVTRVAREVGTEGRLGGQAEVAGVSGTWKDLTDSVNFMAGNLTGQVRNIAQVTTAVAKGDLSQKITVDVKGEMLELKDTINTMVDQLSSFADEVTRVAREVGTEGKLGGQAAVPGVSGTWKDLTDNVNFMAGNLTGQVRNIAQVTTAVAKGDLSQKITVDVKGEMLELKDTINTMVDQLSSFADEVTRVAKEVGTEGRLGGQAEVPGVSGTWKSLTENVNQLAGNLTNQVRNIAQVTTAVAKGDLSQKITVDARGEILELKNTINTMVDQLSSFADEVTRVAREVGTEGKLGGQAAVPGVSGTWKDLTENVNQLAGNLTNQVRNIAQVTTAVAKGDLSQKITVDARGEILELKNTINTMVDQLSSFAAEVTRVAKEVGTEGKLGGQAEVPGVAGTWKDLTHNVNQLAKTLTIQLRAIAEVSTAVTQGDLTRSITVQAEGEIAELKDNINQMISNLRDTTQRNAEQDWLKTNLAKISSMLQGQRDLGTVSRLIMSEVTPVASAQLGAFFMLDPMPDDPTLRLIASYGYPGADATARMFSLGEGLVGQAAVEGKPIVISDAQNSHLQITSGLLSADPVNVVVLPVLFEEQVLAVIELASLRPFTDIERTFLDQTMETIGVVLNTILANMRTEELLEQSQRLTQELQSQSRELQLQQDELRKTNAELQEKAALLSEQNRDIELKNREIELARRVVEEKAEQLALSSRYKSEFLANMSHELRTPLNSLLILTKLLADNVDENLTEQQIEFANTIYAAGSDLLELINDILDLSKVEAGKMDISPTEVRPAEIREYVERTFRPIAEEKDLAFTVDLGEDVPETITTDGQRLQQVLRNLLSNAFKFTETGGVTMTITRAGPDLRYSNTALVESDEVLAFAVSDTGIGVAADKLQLIFEEFQQEDGTTSRRYGGTGLGLSISRAIARLLGGEIHVESEVGSGSTFTLYVPSYHIPAAPTPESETEEAARHGAIPFLTPETTAESARSLPIRRPQPLPAERTRTTDEALAGRRILVVDDDVRNVFALTSALESYGMDVLFAENGKKGIDSLLRNQDVDLVLMDIMMPEMDGYETCRAIRSMPQFQRLPIISLTAKAMTGDREKSIASGASDYITKPVEIDQLLSLMRMWLSR